MHDLPAFQLAPKHSSIAGRGRRNSIASAFASHRVDMLNSPAWRVLSLSGRRVLDRVAIELAHHGGHIGDGLPVTFADFQNYGIERHAIAPAIREVVALGFLRIMRPGRAGNAEFRRATLYRPTYLQSVDSEPTDEWRRITTLIDAKAKSEQARAAQPPRRNRTPVRQTPPTPVGEIRTENDSFPVRETPPQQWGKTTPLSISRRGGRSDLSDPTS
jgi:hypothetical protein